MSKSISGSDEYKVQGDMVRFYLRQRAQLLYWVYASFAAAAGYVSFQAYGELQKATIGHQVWMVYGAQLVCWLLGMVTLVSYGWLHSWTHQIEKSRLYMASVESEAMRASEAACTRHDPNSRFFRDETANDLIFMAPYVSALLASVGVGWYGFRILQSPTLLQVVGLLFAPVYLAHLAIWNLVLPMAFKWLGQKNPSAYEQLSSWGGNRTPAARMTAALIGMALYLSLAAAMVFGVGAQESVSDALVKNAALSVTLVAVWFAYACGEYAHWWEGGEPRQTASAAEELS